MAFWTPLLSGHKCGRATRRKIFVKISLSPVENIRVKIRAEVGRRLREDTRRIILGGALIFVGVGSLAAHFLMGPVFLDPMILGAWVLIHGVSLASVLKPRLDRIFIVTAFLALQLYSKNLLVLFEADFMPMSALFFLVSAVTLTGAAPKSWWMSAMLFAVSWGTSFGWMSELFLARRDLAWAFGVGVLLNGIVLGTFWLSCLLFDKRLSKRLREMGPDRRIDSERIQASKLAQMGQLTAIVAHELGNPLTAARGYTYQLLEESKSADFDPKLFNLSLVRLDENLKRMVDIAKTLRSFSRDPSNDAAQVVALKDVFFELDVLMRPLLKSSKVDLEVQAVAQDIEVFGNRGHLLQVLVNLVANARDAVDQSQTKRVEVGVVLGVDTIEIFVEDSGMGITPEVKKNLFQAFYTTKGVRKGTGLGLYISKSLTEKYGGTLDATNGAAGGARFSIRFPKALRRAA